MSIPTHARILVRRRLSWIMAAGVVLVLAATQLPGFAQSAVDDSLPTVVFVARADNPVDALAASGVAGTLGGTVLLSAQNELSPATRDALIDLDPDLVIIAGGTVALSPAVEQAIQDIPLATQRVSGPTRIETAAALGGLADQLGFGRPILTDATVEGHAGLAGTMSMGALEAADLGVVQESFSGSQTVSSGTVLNVVSVDVDLPDPCGGGDTRHLYMALGSLTVNLGSSGDQVALAKVIVDDEAVPTISTGEEVFTVKLLNDTTDDQFQGFAAIAPQRLLELEPGSSSIHLAVRNPGPLVIRARGSGLALFPAGFACDGVGGAGLSVLPPPSPGDDTN